MAPSSSSFIDQILIGPCAAPGEERSRLSSQSLADLARIDVETITDRLASELWAQGEQARVARERAVWLITFDEVPDPAIPAGPRSTRTRL